jgi:hypothetical protein
MRVKSIHSKEFQNKVLPKAIAKWEKIVASCEIGDKEWSDPRFPAGFFEDCALCDWATGGCYARDKTGENIPVCPLVFDLDVAVLDKLDSTCCPLWDEANRAFLDSHWDKGVAASKALLELIRSFKD